jgi:hypothetical protein
MLAPGEDSFTIPVSINNVGQVDLKGISLNASVKYNDMASDDVTISLAETKIDSLSIGESRNLSLVVRTTAEKFGMYRATVYLSVTSPKFSDWSDIFVELNKVNQTEIETPLIATEKLVSENSECKELTELVNEAKKSFDAGDYNITLSQIQDITSACEKAISLNKIRLSPAGRNISNTALYYIAVAVIAAFIMLAVFYAYRKLKFKKAKKEDYN